MNIEIENMINKMRDRAKKKLKFMEDNSDILFKEIAQEISDVELFNTIGAYAERVGYYIHFFKTKQMSNDFDKPQIVDVHYIHIYKEDYLVASIYFDSYNSILSSMTIPYYEIYVNGDVERFLVSNEEERKLYDMVVNTLK